MDKLGKRRIALASAGLALVALVTYSDPIADVRISHDVATPSIAKLEARLDLGLIAISFLHSWKRALR